MRHTAPQSRLVFTLLATALLMPASVANAAPLPISTCGSHAGQSLILTTDLDCTGFNAAIELSARSAKLDLNGYTLTGGTTATVYCHDKCVITSSAGPGRIEGSDGDGVLVLNANNVKASLRIDNIVVAGNTGRGIVVDNGAARIENCTIENNGDDGALISGKTRVNGSSFLGNGGYGLYASGKLKMEASTLSGNARGLWASSATLKNAVVISNNVGRGAWVLVRASIRDTSIDGNGGDGLFVPSKLRMLDSSVSNNGNDGLHSNPWLKGSFKNVDVSGNGRYGVFLFGFWRARFVDSSITGNGLDGIKDVDIGCQEGDDKVTLVDTTVSGNGIDVSCLSIDCYDLGVGCTGSTACDPDSKCVSLSSNSTCDTSEIGICALD